MAAPTTRFTRRSPCPICGGHEALPHGRGIRCFGYLDSSGEFARCTREDHAGDIQQNADGTYSHRLSGPCHCGKTHGFAAVPAERRIVAEYDYRAPNGELLYQVVRQEPKRFVQRRPDGSGDWIWSLNGTPRVPYRLPELNASGSADVWVLEGEKDVDRLRSLGLTATCNPGGAGKWRSEYSEHLRGRRVTIVPDNDTPGQQHAEQVAASLRGIASEVQIVTLPGLPEHGDVSDFLDNGHSVEELEALARPVAPLVDFLVDFDDLLAPTVPVPTAVARKVPLLERFKTAAQLSTEVPTLPDYVIPPYVVVGAVANLAGKIKQGKTTLIAWMVRSVLNGEPFLGQSVAKGPVVWLTEEGSAVFVQALRRAGIDTHPDLHLLFWADMRDCEWEDIVATAAVKAKQVVSRLLVVDTAPKLARVLGDDENSAGRAREAMSPLQVAATQGLAVLPSFHASKGASREIEDDNRGSSNWGGEADILLSLRKPQGRHPETYRELRAVGRFDVPPSVILNLTADGYVALGSSGAVELSRARDLLLAELPESETEAKAESEFPERLTEELSRTTVKRALQQLVTDGAVSKVGKGVRGDPLRYFRSAAIEKEEAEL